MIKTVRAAGFAAAALLVAAVAGWGNPLQADQVDRAPAFTSYHDHMAAHVGVSDLGLADDEEAAAELVQAGHDRIVQLAGHLVASADFALPRPRPLPELVTVYAGGEPEDSELDCLASAVYFEARGEPIEGQLAVAEVVLNRAASGRYPQGVCDVVTQPWQFSFVNRTGRIPAANRGSEAWQRAVAIARIADRGANRLLPRDVLWYHADYVSPSWGRRLARNTKIGLHIFYS